MNKLSALASTSLLAAVAITIAGCELTAKSTKRFEANPESVDVPWVSGQDLIVDARNGVINVEPGAEGVVRVTFAPFTYRGYDEEAAAMIEMDESLTKVAEVDPGTDGLSFVSVKALKDGAGSSSLGADLTITVPPEFDGGIFIDQGNGDVDINAVGQAVELGVDNHGTGNCLIDGAPSVIATHAWCDGVSVSNVSNFLDIQADGLGGNAFVSLASISGSTSGTVYTEDGDIVFDVPAADGVTIDALAVDEGAVVNAGSPPDGCFVNDIGANEKAILCDSGPVYELRAGLGDLGTGNIEIRYH